MRDLHGRHSVGGQPSQLPSALELSVHTVNVNIRPAGRIPAVEGAPPLSSFATWFKIHPAAANSATTSAIVIGILGIALLGISIVAQRAGVKRRNRLFQVAVGDAAERGAHVTAPSKDLSVLAESVNGLLDEMTARQHQTEAQRETAAAEREASSERRRRAEFEQERERAEAAAEAQRQREELAAERERAAEATIEAERDTPACA